MECLPSEGVTSLINLFNDIFIRKTGRFLKKNTREEPTLEISMYAVLILLDVKISMMLSIADYYPTETMRFDFIMIGFYKLLGRSAYC